MICQVRFQTRPEHCRIFTASRIDREARLPAPRRFFGARRSPRPVLQQQLAPRGRWVPSRSDANDPMRPPLRKSARGGPRDYDPHSVPSAASNEDLAAAPGTLRLTDRLALSITTTEGIDRRRARRWSRSINPARRTSETRLESNRARPSDIEKRSSNAPRSCATWLAQRTVCAVHIVAPLAVGPEMERSDRSMNRSRCVNTMPAATLRPYRSRQGADHFDAKLCTAQI